MKHYNSVLTKIIQEIYNAKTVEEGKKIMIEYLKTTKIDLKAKNKMIYETEQMTSLTKLHFYVTNCMFRFSGMSVNSYKPE